MNVNKIFECCLMVVIEDEWWDGNYYEREENWE